MEGCKGGIGCETPDAGEEGAGGAEADELDGECEDGVEDVFAGRDGVPSGKSPKTSPTTAPEFISS